MDSSCDRRTIVQGLTAGLLGTAVVAGAGTDVEVVTGVHTAASAADIGTKQSPVAVVGAAGEWSEAFWTIDDVLCDVNNFSCVA